MSKMRFLKWLGIEIIAILLIGAYIFIDAKDIYQWWVGDTSFSRQDALCDLHESSCDAILKDKTTLRFEINPKEIPLMKPLHFKVTSSIDIPKIDLKIFATNMNMGFHSFELKKTSQGVYEGDGMLPTCIVGNMMWQANVIVNQIHQSQGAIFTFQTDK